jgi:hypothetical protein
MSDRIENVREALGHLIGQQIIDITQQDGAEEAFIQIMTAEGGYVKIFVGRGFEVFINDKEEHSWLKGDD